MPVGDFIEVQENVLTQDELEALRLKDLEGVDQERAAKEMNISQPTFHRLIKAARKKVAKALIEGNAIKIQGGNFEMIETLGNGKRLRKGSPDFCICPQCGFRIEKQVGVPCRSIKCDKCGETMTRG